MSNFYTCETCGTERYLSDEWEHYFREAGLIDGEELIRCPNCIDHEISIIVEPMNRVLPVPSFGVDALFSPLNAQKIVTIQPSRKTGEDSDG